MTASNKADWNNIAREFMTFSAILPTKTDAPLKIYDIDGHTMVIGQCHKNLFPKLIKSLGTVIGKKDIAGHHINDRQQWCIAIREQFLSDADDAIHTMTQAAIDAMGFDATEISDVTSPGDNGEHDGFYEGLAHNQAFQKQVWRDAMTGKISTATHAELMMA